MTEFWDVEDAERDLLGLIERASKGEAFSITRNGEPIARLLPVAPSKSLEERKKAIAEMRELAKGIKLDGLKIRDLINEGRK